MYKKTLLIKTIKKILQYTFTYIFNSFRLTIAESFVVDDMFSIIFVQTSALGSAYTRVYTNNFHIIHLCRNAKKCTFSNASRELESK